MTQRDGTGREVGGGFRMGNTCTLLGSAPFFAWLDREGVRQSLEYAIETAVTMKRDIVAEDEFDRGRRQLLNLGHTIGHAVERCSGFTVSHGSAVAIGMMIICRAAVKKGICPEDVLNILEKLLDEYELPSKTEYSAVGTNPRLTEKCSTRTFLRKKFSLLPRQVRWKGSCIQQNPFRIWAKLLIISPFALKTAKCRK